MRTANKKLLKAKIELAYQGEKEEMPNSPTIESALTIFKKIKEMERDDCGTINYTKELLSAKEDIENIFGKKPKSMSKSNLYMEHQSLMVNSIYAMLNEGEN